MRRSLLTVAIIATGVTALVGILTATEALKATVSDSLGKMGGQLFSIISQQAGRQPRPGQSVRNERKLRWSELLYFREHYRLPGEVSFSCVLRRGCTVRHGTDQTPPTVDLMAVDENYLDLHHYRLAAGRDLLVQDMQAGAAVAVIGNGIRRLLFPGQDPVGATLSVAGRSCRVVGVLEKVGHRFGGGVENALLLPLTHARSRYADTRHFYRIDVLPVEGVPVGQAVGAAEQIFRTARRLEAGDENDFEIRRSDLLETQMNEMMDTVTLSGGVIALITLFGASIGLMNIMLVSVKERTREIGTRKALGASPARIRMQFLLESILIGQFGGGAGIVLGILAGNLTAMLMEASFLIPWRWMAVAVLSCLAVSVLSGYIPAQRAARQDPIEALRYE